MGTSRGRPRQATMWVPTADLPKSAGHPFYERLNRVLDEAGFDAFVEAKCASFYADGVGWDLDRAPDGRTLVWRPDDEPVDVVVLGTD